MTINRCVVAVLVLLGCSLFFVVESFSCSSSSSLISSRSSTTISIMKPLQYRQQRQRRGVYSYWNNEDNNNEQEGGSKHSGIIQNVLTTCFVTTMASLFWMSTTMMIPSHAAVAKELTNNKDLTTTVYNQRNANLFVGGYTVKGTKLSMMNPGNNNNNNKGKQKVQVQPLGGEMTERFQVAQECICSVETTEHGIFARGANPENPFLFLATINDKNEWTAEQTSVGATPPYKATMRFGKIPGGPHTVVGSTTTTLNSKTDTVVAFSAEQSAMGCNEGGEDAAAACEAVCGKHGLSWEMIRRRCGL